MSDSLWTAVYNGNIDDLKLICDGDPSQVNSKNMHGDTILHIACHIGCLEIIKYIHLLNKHLMLVKNKSKQSPLFLVSQRGYIDCVRFICAHNPSQLKSRDISGNTVLIAVCNAPNKLNILKYLCSLDKSLVSVANYMNQTPLFFVAKNSILSYVKYIYSRDKSQADVYTNDGQSVLHASCIGGNIEVFKYIYLNNKHLLNIVDHNLNSVFYLAAKYGRNDIITFILQQDESKILERDINNKSMLQVYCECCNCLVSIENIYKRYERHESSARFDEEIKVILQSIKYIVVHNLIKRLYGGINCPCCRTLNRHPIKLYGDFSSCICLICRNPVENPRALKCGHIFCMECLHMLYEK